MSECVLCLGNRRKQTLKVEILISELQSKLWKRDLRALNRGPHSVRKSGIPPENPLHTHLADPDRRCVWMGAVFLTLERTPWQRVLGSHSLGKFHRCLCPQTQRYDLFVRAVLGPRCVLLSQGTFPLQVCYATCLWNIFFSYLRDKWDLHFPLHKSDYASYPPPQISDIWSKSNLFSYLTFSNNWALALAELVAIISERKVRISTLCVAGEQEGLYSVTRIPLLMDSFWTHPETSLWRLLGW